MTKENKEPKVTPKATEVSDVKAQILAKKAGTPIKLPSGLVFLLKKPSIARLMQLDVFPAELVSTAIKMDANNLQPTSRDEYLQYLKVIDTVVMHSCVQPKVVDSEADVPEDSIFIGDIDDMDRVFIFMHAQMGVDSQKSFRSEQQNSNDGSSVPKVPGEEA